MSSMPERDESDEESVDDSSDESLDESSDAPPKCKTTTIQLIPEEDLEGMCHVRMRRLHKLTDAQRFAQSLTRSSLSTCTAWSPIHLRYASNHPKR